VYAGKLIGVLEGGWVQEGLGTGGFETCSRSSVFCVWQHSNKYRLDEPDTDAACYENGHGRQQEW